MKDLLQLLIDTIENKTLSIPSAYNYTLQSVVSTMGSEGVLKSPERDKLKNWLKEQLPDVSTVKSYMLGDEEVFYTQECYNQWDDGDMKPRLKWLNRQLSKLPDEKPKPNPRSGMKFGHVGDIRSKQHEL